MRSFSRSSAVAMLVSLAMAIAACGSDASSDDAPTDSVAPVATDATGTGDSNGGSGDAGDGLATEGRSGDAAHGDALGVVVAAPAATLDPAAINTAFVAYVIPAYEPLIHLRSDGTLQPGLAESWEMGEGNTSMTLTIRDGVQFSDGDEVTADAVVASLTHAQGTATGNGFFLAGATIAAEGEVVTIGLPAPNPTLPLMLSSAYGIGGIISPTGLEDPAALTADNPSHGAGPYVFDPDQSVAGDHYTYVANPDYYAKDLYQHYDTVTLQVIADAQASLNALQTGQVDVITGDLSTIAQAQSAGLQVIGVPFVWQGLNLIDRDGEVSPALGDVRVRQAINHALDRDLIANALLPGIAVPTATIAVPGGDGWSQEAADRFPYDPDLARELLTEAGYGDGLEIGTLSVQFAGIDVMAEAIAGQLAEVGITLDITLTTDEASYVGGMTDHSFPVVAVGYGAQPVHLMGQGLFMPNAMPFNGFGSQRDELDELYATAASAAVDDVPAANQAIIRYLTDEAWFAPVAFAPVTYIAGDSIGGLRVSPDAPVVSLLEWYELA